MSKTERLELRLDENIVDTIDQWRRKEQDLPTRSEAVRRLIQQGLSSSSKQAYTLMKTQLLVAARLPKSDSFLSDSTLFAWAHDVYPALGMNEDMLAEPFAQSFSVTREMMEELGGFIDETWLKRRSLTYYELEEEFSNLPWTRGGLINACKYMFIRELFSGLWEHLLEEGECPIEAKTITQPFDRKDIFIS